LIRPLPEASRKKVDSQRNSKCTPELVISRYTIFKVACGPFKKKIKVACVVSYEGD
jgi:hypothetical protein